MQLCLIPYKIYGTRIYIYIWMEYLYGIFELYICKEIFLRYIWKEYFCGIFGKYIEKNIIAT